MCSAAVLQMLMLGSIPAAHFSAFEKVQLARAHDFASVLYRPPTGFVELAMSRAVALSTRNMISVLRPREPFCCNVALCC
jgi:hypothetical protein